jgi:hypothetical protein
MSDEIYCAVDGCEFEAEIEVERNGSSLWLCVDHYKDFIEQPELSDDELIDFIENFRAELYKRWSKERIEE